MFSYMYFYIFWFASYMPVLCNNSIIHIILIPNPKPEYIKVHTLPHTVTVGTFTSGCCGIFTSGCCVYTPAYCGIFTSGCYVYIHTRILCCIRFRMLWYRHSHIFWYIHYCMLWYIHPHIVVHTLPHMLWYIHPPIVVHILPHIVVHIRTSTQCSTCTSTYVLVHTLLDAVVHTI